MFYKRSKPFSEARSFGTLDDINSCRRIFIAENKLALLKSILAVPTKYEQEDLLIRYLIDYCLNRYDLTIDSYGNIYIQKGVSSVYPCVTAHLDTVHEIKPIKVVQENDLLFGMDEDFTEYRGIGGDDKSGVFICLQLLETLKTIKIALFVSEELFCAGSKKCNFNGRLPGSTKKIN